MESELEKIMEFIVSQRPQTEAKFDAAKKKICGKLKIKQPANRHLLKAYQRLNKKKRIEPAEGLLRLLRKANIRSLSGIAIVTSLIKPYTCPGKCVYCPTEKRMPKSYIATEPAAARALGLDFSPYQQMKQRIEILESNGHNCSKIEFIIKGGTWNAYPLAYQYWFILESFKACNDFARKSPLGETKEPENATIEELKQSLEKEQTYNESADHRIIGLTLETRPDHISPKTIYHMRQQGCTRIELGLQAPDDKILALVNRGHTVAQFKDAIKLLRQAGFKVDLHFMPDLPGTSPEHDVKMYKLLFEDHGLRPDMVKIYPCTVIKSAELYGWLKDGRYQPYSAEELFQALLQMKLATPRYCRISRLIRDIPSDEIEAGNKITNLREELTKELTRLGQKCVCLRCREIGRHPHILADPKAPAPQLYVDEYETVGGNEFFISIEDSEKNAVYGFLRLRLPSSNSESDLDGLFPELKNAALIRELHVYGQLVPVGERSSQDSQHKGLGTKLVAEAERIAQKNGFRKVAVISGVGVRGYYKKLGYKKVETYVLKKI